MADKYRGNFKTKVNGTIFEVLRAVLLEIQFFRNVRPCTLVNSKPYLEDSQYSLLYDHSVYTATTLRNVGEHPPLDIPEISELRKIWGVFILGLTGVLSRRLGECLL